MVQSLGKGQYTAGKIIADIQAAAGSIGTAELADNSVTDAKYLQTVTTASAALATEGVNLLVSAGSSVGTVFTIGTPVVGVHYKLVAYSGIGGSSKPTCLKSTAATFDGSNKVLKFQANGAAREIVAVTTTRWVVLPDLACSTGVVAAATT